MKKEEIRKSKYEILCIIKEVDGEKKNSLIKKMEEVIKPGKIEVSSEIKKLAYPIEKLESADYTLLNFEANRSDISLIEEIIKNSFVVRHMTLNLDTEKKIKISAYLKNKKPNFPKYNKNERNKKGRFERRSDNHSSPLEIKKD